MLFALISTDMIEGLLARGWSRRRIADGIALLLRSTFVATERRPGEGPDAGATQPRADA